jgi:hypothetical protein
MWPRIPCIARMMVWQGANSDISDASNSEGTEDEQEQHEHEDQDEDEDEDEHARLISFLKECLQLMIRFLESCTASHLSLPVRLY